MLDAVGMGDNLKETEFARGKRSRTQKSGSVNGVYKLMVAMALGKREKVETNKLDTSAWNSFLALIMLK